MSKDKFYITTAIDYVNDKPHLGHALEKIQADVLARYHRLKGEEVLFLTGTDEHGIKIQRAAEKAGKTPEEFVEEISAKFEDLKNSLNLSWDRFIRTTDKDMHYPGVEQMWRKLRDNGDLVRRKYRGLYCVGHEAFITERDLVEGKCADHGKEPEVIEEENWFFKLKKYESQIRDAIESGNLEIFPSTRKNEILSLINQGLEDVSFSRPRESLSWGIAVPDDPEQTIYVWADALVNYISAIGYGRDEAEFKKWWPADAQVIGKDILRFHAAIWPAMLLAAGLPLPKKLFVHGFITVEGQKMSKTIGNVIDPEELAAEYGTDALRFYLLHEISSAEDGDFGREKMKTAYNAHLANGLGNLVARVMKMAVTYGVESVLLPEKEIFADNRDILDSLEIFEMKKAIEAIWLLKISHLDGMIQETEPFKLIKTDEPRAKEIIGKLVAGVYEIAVLLEPFLPEAAKKIQTAIKNKEVPPILFPRKA